MLPTSPTNELYGDNLSCYYDNNPIKMSLELGQAFSTPDFNSLTNDDTEWLDQVVDLQELLEESSTLSPLSPDAPLSPISVQEVDECFLLSGDSSWTEDLATGLDADLSPDLSPDISPYMSPITAPIYNENESFGNEYAQSNTAKISPSIDSVNNNNSSVIFANHFTDQSPVSDNSPPSSIISSPIYDSSPSSSIGVEFAMTIDYQQSSTDEFDDESVPITDDRALDPVVAAAANNAHVDVFGGSLDVRESKVGPIRRSKFETSVDGSKLKTEEKRMRKKQQNKDAAIRYRFANSLREIYRRME